MFSRVFNLNHKKEKVVTQCEDERKSVKVQKGFQAPPNKLPILNKEKIRILIYKDSEPRGDRTLLFDSDALEKEDENSHSDLINQKFNGHLAFEESAEWKKKYKCRKPSSDTKMLGEMIFGSVAMIYKGAVVKVHMIRSPPQLLMTKVFALRSRSSGVILCDTDLQSSGSFRMCQSVSADTSSSENIRSYSNPTPVSHPIPTPMQPSFLLKSGVNVYSYNEQSKSYSSFVSNKSPNGCLQTRFNRFQKTNLDSPSLWRSKSECSDELRGTHKQQPKIGIGIIFKQWDSAEENRAFQTFFFSHYALIEWHLQILRVKIEKSFYLHQNFMNASVLAVESFKEDILKLFYTPRILEPTWLKLTSDDAHSGEHINVFMNSFMHLATICEQKETNYFLSILLTAVLSHHTSWVATVMSSGSSSKRAFMDKHSSKAVAVLAKCHPYNPLWAQLCDMYGSVSVPLKLARTVIVGQNKSLVCQLLQVLTYFIRCSDVKETVMHMEQDDEKQGSPLSSSFGENTLNFSSNTPSSVKSWVDNIPTPKVPYNKEEILPDAVSVEKKSTELLPKIFDETQCYCNLLQKVDSVASKGILKCHKQPDNVKYSVEYLSSSTTAKLSGKSCYGCGTLEKLIYDLFCEQCKKNKFSIEVDLMCHTCLKRLEKLKLPHSFIDTSMQSVCKKPSFVCYCCSPNNHEEFEQLYRPRKFSDPIPCVSPKTKSATRNCTKSHDSGTEEMNFTPSLNEEHIFSRNSSISSQSSSTAVADMDSDYCSVDNDSKRFSLIDQYLTDSNCFNVNDCNSSGTLKNFELGFPLKNINYHEEKKNALNKDLEKMHLKVLSMPRTTPIKERNRDNLDSGHMTFGRSLFAGYSESYSSNFVLQGVSKIDKEKLAMDLKNSIQYSVLDEEASDAICIVANVDKWTCEVWNLTRRTNSCNLSISESLNTKAVYASDLVSSMVESTKGLWELKFSPSSCLLHIEEQLKDIYNRGKVLVEFARSNPENVLSAYVQSSGYHSNDVDLLTAVGSTYAFDD